VTGDWKRETGDWKRNNGKRRPETGKGRNFEFIFITFSYKLKSITYDDKN